MAFASLRQLIFIAIKMVLYWGWFQWTVSLAIDPFKYLKGYVV